MKKLICKIFGHPDRPHLHEPTDVITCNGGCEKRYGKVHWIDFCPRCGALPINLDYK